LTSPLPEGRRIPASFMEVSVKYSRKPVEERDINSLYLEKNRKIESIKNKLNALLKRLSRRKSNS
jgi:hypothetical protein